MVTEDDWTGREDAAMIEAFLAGFTIGNGFDVGRRPTLQDYEEWSLSQLTPVPKRYVRCDQPGGHAQHVTTELTDPDDDGDRWQIVCQGDPREEDLQW